MLKISIDRETMRKAIDWHAREGKGLTPVIESDEDLVDWTHYILATLTGYDPNEETTPLQVDIRNGSPSEENPTGQSLVITGSIQILDAVESYIL